MKKILIVSGHTDLSESFANKTILEELEHLLPEAEFDYLDRLYPGYYIDVRGEQEKLLHADIIVWQYPINWYRAPSLLHRWLEDVFTFGFAYGDGGDKLKGKGLLLSFTSGSTEDMYRYGGAQGYPIEELLPGYKQTAVLCHLDWLGYIYTGGFSYVDRNNPEAVMQAKEKAVKHAQRLAEKLKSL